MPDRETTTPSPEQQAMGNFRIAGGLEGRLAPRVQDLFQDDQRTNFVASLSLRRRLLLPWPDDLDDGVNAFSVAIFSLRTSYEGQDLVRVVGYEVPTTPSEDAKLARLIEMALPDPYLQMPDKDTPIELLAQQAEGFAAYAQKATDLLDMLDALPRVIGPREEIDGFSLDPRIVATLARRHMGRNDT